MAPARRRQARGTPRDTATTLRCTRTLARSRHRPVPRSPRPRDRLTARSPDQVGDMPLCRVLLNDDETWPWLVLVPRREGMVEMHDLDEEDQAQLMRAY